MPAHLCSAETSAELARYVVILTEAAFVSLHYLISEGSGTSPANMSFLQCKLYLLEQELLSTVTEVLDTQWSFRTTTTKKGKTKNPTRKQQRMAVVAQNKYLIEHIY